MPWNCRADRGYAAGMLQLASSHMLVRLGLVVLVLGPAAACTGDELVFPEWTIDVPEGIPVHGYAGVPRAERTDRIELVEDLVLAPTDPDIAFYRAWRFDVDDDDNIYIADDGHKHVVVFDRDGNYLRRFGREGRGPGEFVSSQDIYVSGDRIVLGDWRGRRINIWDLQGNRIDEIELGSRQLVDIPGRPWSEDSFVATTIVDDRRREYDAAIERYDFELRALTRYLVYTATRNIPVGDTLIHDPSVRVGYAVERGGNVYFTRGDRAQVLAYSGDGTPAWAARTTWPAPPLDDEIKRRTMESYYNPEGMTVGSPGWPDTIAAVSRLAVDGAGRLWVYLREGYDNPPLGQDVPVDVFDRNGERLCACMAPNRPWQAAGPGYVLALDRDPVTDEYRVVRYRLELPF